MSGEAFTQDLRRNSVTWLLVDKAGFADPTDPKITELNSVNERLVLDITCALDEEATSFTIGSSEIDERLSFCDGVGAGRPSEANPELTLGIYRDEDRDANGVFNKAFSWLVFPDKNYFLVQRVGDQDTASDGVTPKTPFATTDDIRIMEFNTDFGADTLADGDPALLSISPIPNGMLAWNISPSA